MQLWAVMIVRNEVDILALNVLHHLSMGVDRFLIVDNGSTDGTGAVLGLLSRDWPIRWTIDPGPCSTVPASHRAGARGVPQWCRLGIADRRG